MAVPHVPGGWRALRPCIMVWSVKTPLTTAKNLSVKFLRLFHRPRARKAKNQAPKENPTSTDSVVVSSDHPLPHPPITYNTNSRTTTTWPNDFNNKNSRPQVAIGSAQATRRSLARLPSGISDIWQGSLNDKVVAVKSLRCYSSFRGWDRKSLPFFPIRITLTIYPEVPQGNMGIYSTFAPERQ